MATKSERFSKIQKEKELWERELTDWTKEYDDWSRKIEKPKGRMTPRMGLRALEKSLPKDVMISTDIGNICVK